MNVLYILMRTDLASMNPGKAMAQASHATSLFHLYFDEMRHKPDSAIEDAYHAWSQEADGFGTCLVLGAPIDSIREAVAGAFCSFFPCGIVHDPTYPLRDGDVTHYIPLDTCAWIFGDKAELDPILGHLNLHC